MTINVCTSLALIQYSYHTASLTMVFNFFFFEIRGHTAILSMLDTFELNPLKSQCVAMCGIRNSEGNVISRDAWVAQWLSICLWLRE